MRRTAWIAGGCIPEVERSTGPDIHDCFFLFGRSRRVVSIVDLLARKEEGPGSG